MIDVSGPIISRKERDIPLKWHEWFYTYGNSARRGQHKARHTQHPMTREVEVMKRQ